jgi:hypothetical protein
LLRSTATIAGSITSMCSMARICSGVKGMTYRVFGNSVFDAFVQFAYSHRKETRVTGQAVSRIGFLLPITP